jgi:CelD/BcsL family acetyltransferase involved in cellulose biosynthesis
VYRGQQFSFDEAWGGLSIGNLLQDQMIAWLCEQGVERYDMGPEMPYMRRFAEDRATQSAFFLQF